MPNTRIDRRQWFHRWTASAATLSAMWATRTSAEPVSVNERIRVGVIGTGNRARQLMTQLPAEAEIVAVCDCNRSRLSETIAMLKTSWPTYQDYRRMFDREQLDAVIIATPDHGRSLPCIVACQAGLDVYAEKPLTAYVEEGRRIVEAARRYDRVFQVGTQQRTMEINDYCCQFVREGGLGDLTLIEAMNYPGPIDFSKLEDAPEPQPIPEGNDWDRWLGPTAERPYRAELQFQWMRWREYSGGEMTNWGAHGVDQIQWATGHSLSGPTTLKPISPGPNGKVSARYASGLEVRFGLDRGPMGGAIFHGTKGKLEINRNRFATQPEMLLPDPPQPAVREKWELPGWIAGPHLQNWLDCIRSRDRPNADVEIGHRSVTFCHLVNITRELGRELRWDPELETFVDDPEACERLVRHRRKGYELPSL